MEMAWGKEDEGRKGESKGGGEGTPPLSPCLLHSSWVGLTSSREKRHAADLVTP